MRPELNEIYVYRPSASVMEGMFEKLSHRHVKGQLTYYTKNGHRYESEDVHRFAITVTIKGESRTLLMLTKDRLKKNASATFKEAAKQIEADEAKLKIFNAATGKPEALGIFHEG